MSAKKQNTDGVSADDSDLDKLPGGDREPDPAPQAEDQRKPDPQPRPEPRPAPAARQKPAAESKPSSEKKETETKTLADIMKFDLKIRRPRR